MKTITKIFTIIFALAIISSCKKNGTGGKATIKGYVKHHEQLIPLAKVYIKYGATEFPSSNVSNYDASVDADANAYYEVKNLRTGDYYLYGVGYDSTISAPVFGGTNVKIKYSERKDEIEINVQVVE